MVVREPVGMGWEHEQKTQFLKRELKPVEHQVGIVAAIISRSRMSGFSSFHPKPDRLHPPRSQHNIMNHCQDLTER